MNFDRKGKKLERYLVFVDLQKAFDMVNRGDILKNIYRRLGCKDE